MNLGRGRAGRIVQMKVVIIGTGKLARLVSWYDGERSAFTTHAYTYHENREPGKFMGYPVVSYRALPKLFPPSEFGVFVCEDDPEIRVKCFYEAKERGYRMPNFETAKARFHPNLQMGENNLLLDGSHVEPYVILGDNNVLWCDSHVCAHSRIGSHNFLDAESLVGRDCEIGNNCRFGMRSMLLDGARVSDDTEVSPGEFVGHRHG